MRSRCARKRGGKYFAETYPSGGETLGETDVVEAGGYQGENIPIFLGSRIKQRFWFLMEDILVKFYY
jgi:hypothetical protein